jgi:hypothetical protein
MTKIERPLDFDGGYLPNVRVPPIGTAVRTAGLLAALLAYAVRFVLLYPIAQTSVMKSASDGNDPALIVLGP